MLMPMMGGVARQAGEMRLDVDFAEAGFVTPGTTMVDHIRLGIGIAPDLLRIASRFHMGRAGTVTSLAAARLWRCALQRRGMRGLCKRLVRVVVATLANIGSDTLLTVGRRGFGFSLLRQERNADPA